MLLSPNAAPHIRKPNRQHSFPLLVRRHDEHERRDAALQLQWNSTMESCGGRNSSLYKHVKALVISWDEQSDDLKTKPEVRW